MVKILQTGDIHVGECRSLSEYLIRHREVLDRITEISESHDFLIISGDIFHTKTISNEEKFLIDYWFSSLEKKKIKTIVISGNHDHLYGSVTHLDGYSHFPWEYLKIVSTHPQSFLQENVGFICIPWGGYSEGELTDIVLSFHKHIYSCRYVVVVCHECLLGSVFDNGVSSKKGHKLPDIPWVTYWAVGDIHKAQNAGLPNAFYAGAPMQFKFQDVLDKFVLSVDLSDPCNPVQIKIDSKKLITVYSLDAVVEDGRNFYMVKGSDPKELITAHKYNSVIKTNWEESSEAETISLENDDIFIGLYEFLKEKGFSEQEISFARDLVVNLRD